MQGNRFQLLAPADMSSSPLSLRNHLCFLYSREKRRILLQESDVIEHAVHSAKTADCDAMSAILRHVPMSRFVEVGEFHVGGTWVDTLGSAVSLPMSSQIDGAACLM